MEYSIETEEGEALEVHGGPVRFYSVTVSCQDAGFEVNLDKVKESGETRWIWEWPSCAEPGQVVNEALNGGFSDGSIVQVGFETDLGYPERRHWDARFYHEKIEELRRERQDFSHVQEVVVGAEKVDEWVVWTYDSPYSPGIQRSCIDTAHDEVVRYHFDEPLSPDIRIFRDAVERAYGEAGRHDF
ncbi:MAG: hypothetical protein ABEJ03_02120 [Candidatus Nanohaloarchaea archaeon]